MNSKFLSLLTVLVFANLMAAPLFAATKVIKLKQESSLDSTAQIRDFGHGDIEIINRMTLYTADKNRTLRRNPHLERLGFEVIEVTFDLDRDLGTLPIQPDAFIYTYTINDTGFTEQYVGIPGAYIGSPVDVSYFGIDPITNERKLYGRYIVTEVMVKE